MPKNIIIMDDHPLIIEGVKLLLSDSEDFKITKTVATWTELWSALTQSFDILILDLNIRGVNSIQYIERIKQCQPNLKILVFSSYNTPSLVRRAFEQNVDGYLLKDTEKEELFNAFYTILNDEKFIGERVAIPKKRLLKKSDFNDFFIKKATLTKREKEIMQLIIDGFESQMIAEKLFISLHTVQSHRKNIFKKMDVHSVTELVKLAHNVG
jgi:DNA-binding NarL/FixJ family response regulator